MQQLSLIFRINIVNQITMVPVLPLADSEEADIVVAVHSSRSTSEDDFSKLKTYLKSLFAKADVNSGKVQISCIVYGRDARTIFYLNQYNTSQQVSEAIDRISPRMRDNIVDSSAALVRAREMFGYGARATVPKALFMITDSASTVKTSTVENQKALLQGDGVDIFSIGVGIRDKSELELLSTSPNNIYNVQGYGQLAGNAEELRNRVYAQCFSEKLDLVFVMDSSTSVSEQNFWKMKSFLRTMVSAADVDSGNVRVGLISYSEIAEVRFYLNTYSTKSDILKGITEMPYVYGRTNTADALRVLWSEMYTNVKGDRRDVPNTAIVVTDGVSNINQARTQLEAINARATGIHIYAIGIGLPDLTELNGIATSPASRNRFTIDNFEELENLPGKVFKTICTECKAEVDLVIIIDSSTSVGPDNYEKTKTFVTDLLRNAEIDSGLVRVGIVTYSTNVDVRFNLNTYSTKTQIFDAIQNIEYTYGSTNTAGAIGRMRNTMFTTANGDRPNVPNVAIIITDGVSNINARETIPEAEAARKANIHIYAIGIECGLAKVDLVFVLDSSTSVGQDNYDKMLNFLKDFLRNADIDSGSIRVGVVSYSTGVHLEFKMNDYTTQQEVFNAIDNIPYRYGSTNTADGLRKMHNEMFTARNGDREDVPNIAIVITDGVSNINSRRTIPESNAAKKKVDGGFSTWADWGPCSVTCGVGYTRRSRQCNNPSPQFGGANCVGDYREQISCELDPCPIDGGFSRWSDWSVCSATCGRGISTRTRSCDSPAPQYGGQDCNGEREEQKQCMIQECQVINEYLSFQECGLAKVDLVFVLDSSTSVGQDNYDKMLKFLKDFLSNADIDSGSIRVGVVSYSTGVHVEFQMNDFTTQLEVFNAIDNIPYRYGSTNTADGLRKMHDGMFTAANGDRDGVPNIAIVITDGVSNINSRRTIPEADAAKGKGIHVYVIGIGLKDTREIFAMATAPASENAFTVTGFDELRGLDEQIFSAICPVSTPSPSGYDLVVVLDSSVNRETFQWMTDFVKSLTSQLNIDGGDFRVGVMRYSSTADVQFNLKDYTTQAEMAPAIDVIDYKHGETDTAKAFEAVRTRMFRAEKGDRDFARNYILYLTGNERSLNTDKIWREAERVEDDDIGIFVVGINTDETTEIDETSTHPLSQYRFLVRGRRELMEIPGQLDYRIRENTKILLFYVFDRIDMPAVIKQISFFFKKGFQHGHNGKVVQLHVVSEYEQGLVSAIIPVPQFGGADCDGEFEEFESCESVPCPRSKDLHFFWKYFDNIILTNKEADNFRENLYFQIIYINPNLMAGFSRWSDWSQCSKTCGLGTKTRQRSCDNPAPQYGGRDCAGILEETTECQLEKCQECGLAKVDLVFVLDSSTSVGQDNYNKMMNFLKDFLTNADIDSGSIRVGVVSYSTGVHVEFQLNDYTTQQEVFDAIDNIPYRYGSTNTADGLLRMHSQMFTARNGDRDDAPNIAIVITDGVSNINSRRTIPEADRAKEKGIHVYIIGIGLTDTREIFAMATAPASENAFTVTGFDELKGLDQQIFSAICPALAFKIRYFVIFYVAFVNLNLNLKCKFLKCFALVDGGFSTWTEWDVCSATCGEGIKTRTRECNNPTPQFGGRDCEGDLEEFAACEIIPCPIDGGLSRWSEWTECSQTCGLGTKSRQRSCDSPTPQYGGRDCYGATVETTECQLEPCQGTNKLYNRKSERLHCNEFLFIMLKLFNKFLGELFFVFCSFLFFFINPLIECGLAKVDLVFVLDSSTSVGQGNYNKMLNFLKEFLTNADIDSGSIRVGVVSYSTGVHVEFQMNDYTTQQEVFNAIDNIPYRYGSTNTADGLRKMHNEMFTAKNGDRDGVPNIAIVITDGVSNINSRRTIPEADAAKGKGIHVYVIGIGLTDTREIYAMATAPASENAFTVTGFDELTGLDEQIFSAICPVSTPAPTAYDLVIVMDSSVNRRTYRWMLAFVKNLTGQLNIDNGEFRVGLLRYSTSADVQFNLEDYTTRNDINPAVDLVQYQPGETNTAKAFETVRTQMFRPNKGDRDYARNYILLLTGNEESLDTNEIWREAERVEDEDIGIFVVGIGLNDTREVDETSTHPLSKYRYLVGTRGQLLKIPGQIENTIRGRCMFANSIRTIALEKKNRSIFSKRFHANFLRINKDVIID
ncbi:hypothetical protein KUTeg_001572 [Tegillarca granosa]|uniref:VWFA domain-containing protein n=1 Tax=Tegillarca granosa TaxID=220873 RepID=A0ABQ9FRW5_TEGGR|nr:hypothetical protein KUTeg_001572 [Tegillarca granosa]